MADPEIADFDCDQNEGVLRIIEDCQGDHYLTIGPRGRPVVLQGPSVRFCASGTRHKRTTHLAVSILFCLGSGDVERAKRLVGLLAERLDEKDEMPW